MLTIYFDFRDWWVGYYRGDEYHYVCLIPTLVFRWGRKTYQQPNTIDWPEEDNPDY